MRKGGGKPSVPIEEYVRDRLGNEKVLKRWASIGECSADLGVDPKTIRGRILRGTVLVISLGEIRYRRGKNEADG